MDFQNTSFSLDNKAIILSDGGVIKNTLTYNQVYETQQRISNFIRNHVTVGNQCIGLLMSHNIYIPSIILSLQQLQHCFIFLSFNEEEQQSTIQELEITWVISFKRNEKYVAELILDKDTLTLVNNCNRQTKIYKDVFYIIRTSGTTGESKFVKVGKSSIESNVKCLSKIFNIQPTDVIWFGTALTFDPSMIELLLALYNGACLLITLAKHQINSLYDTLFHPKNGITVLQIVPSLFLRWSDVQIQNILLNTRLKILAFGGECFPHSLLNCKRCDSLRMFNLYGITEVSCWATIFEVGEEKMGEVPLGNALEDTLVEVRDASGNVITEGEGEVYIGSANRICLVNNEVKNPEFRASGDIAQINNAGIFYKGRKNDVFKRFGCKLQLSRIECMVEKATGLPNKCVWLKNQSKLLLFLIIENFNDKTKNKILDKVRIKLLHALPKQHFPDYVDIVRKCPVTSHGKIDKNALEAIYLSRNQTAKTAVDILESLVCKYFGVSGDKLEGLGNATFFELGGNSILAIQFLNEFREEMGTDCAEFVTALFEKDLSSCFRCARFLKVGQKRHQSCKNDRADVAKRVKSNVEMRIAWTYNLEACVDSTPLVFHHGEQILVAVGSFSHIVVVLDASNGKEIAKFVLPDVVESSPCVSPCHNYLYVGCFDGCLYCLDFNSNSIKWFYSANDRIKCKPVLCRRLTSIVFGSYDKHVHCIDLNDGALVWKTCVEESVTATPIIQREKIYIATICGTCLCLSEGNGHVLWRYKTANPIFGTPCIYDNIIIWPSVSGCILFLSSNGDKIGQFECDGHVFSSLILYDNTIIFGCDSRLYILEIDSDGSSKIRTIVELGDVLTTPCIYKDQIVVASNSGRIFFVSFGGAVLSDVQLPGNIFSSVVTHGHKVFVGCRDNNLYCVNIVE